MSTPKIYWQRKARLVALRWNFAAWLHLFLRFAAVLSFIMMCAVLMLRRAETPTQIAWYIYGGALLAGAIASFFLARKKFCSSRDALVRLDATLGFYNRLTAASDGVGDWPVEISDTPDGLRWRWERIAIPPLACLAALAFAALVKMPGKDDSLRHKEEPLSWSRVETEVETLKKQDVINEESINNIKEQVSQLRGQASDKWYSHSSLEASDNLQAKTDEAIRSLQRDLESASNMLGAAQQAGDSMGNDQAQKNAAQFKQAVQGLQLGNLPVNEELLNQLKGVDPNKMNNLTPKQMADLQQKLKKGIAGAQAALNPLGGDAQARLIGLLQQQQNGMGMGNQNNTGAGGPGGGGGPSPLGFKPDMTNLDTNNTEKIANDDLSHAAAGDSLGAGMGEHKIDPNAYTGPVNAGGIKSAGEGGDAVWKNQLTPQEREILERFYK